MKSAYGFIRFYTEEEFKNWLKNKSVTRRITRLQVHHMDLSNYSTWEKTDKKVFSEPHFGQLYLKH